jgi:hypothetical protein
MSLITVGTMAFDAIETPFGKVDKIIGGSATYVAYAAANFKTNTTNFYCGVRFSARRNG